MALPDEKSRPPAPSNIPDRRSLRYQNLPSPALCCACGLCIMLAGINITLVGAFAFGTFSLAANPPIIIGPLLLLLALAFFTACCVVSRRPSSHMARKTQGGEKWGLMRMGTVAFEMEMSEHTLQDTTAVQLSPTNSLSSSHKSTSNQGDGSAPAACQNETKEPQSSEKSDTGADGDETSLTSENKEGTSTQLLPDQKTSFST
ncbi:transmembrane protein 275-like [Poeciliopsis prolifica]|uniref:transmembrane protein 275-like n=1 Tax=Poeciliopsis prolifica TaxID=188132 RepID=UPI002413BF0D|nr:transmembrane protein 275-like [Poeciliopsis prolifica]